MDTNDATPRTPAGDDSPWLTIRGGAQRAKCSTRTIYDAIRGGKLRAAKLTTRREYRIHVEWLDAWIAASAELVNPNAPAGNAPAATLSRFGRPS